MKQTGIFEGRVLVPYAYGCFGWTRGGGSVWHGGIDLVGADDPTIRMPYYTAAEGSQRAIRGTVITARKVDKSTGNRTWEWGWYVCVRLDANQTPDAVNYLYFCHCERLLVRVGQKVISGQELAIMGNSGNAALNNPPYKHCHLEVRATSTGRGLDPTAYAGVPNKAGTYGNTDPLPLPAAGRLQIIYLDKLTRGDADAILLCCVGHKLTDAGLYTSKWDDDSHTTQSIIIGPVSQGDADAILATARARELDKQGLYRSAWADEVED